MSVIVINKNSNAYKNAMVKNDLLKLSESIYHEIKAHVESKINPILGDEKSGKQEHFRYHGQYSKYSPEINKMTPNTPRQNFIDQAKIIIQEMGDLIQKSVINESKSKENDR